MRRQIGLLIAVLVLTAAGCGGKDETPTESPVEATETAAPEETEEVTAEPEAAGESETEGALLLTIDGDPVYQTEINYWVKVIASYYMSQNDLEEITDWDDQVDGMPLAEYFLAYAVESAGQDRAIEALAEENGVALTDEQRQEIEDFHQQNLEIYGSYREYMVIVTRTYQSEAVLNYLMELEYLGAGLYEALYGEGGELCSDEEIQTYADEHGIVCAKYVYLPATDGNLAAIEDLRAQLEAGEDPAEAMDALYREYAEDTASAYPNGYFFDTTGMDDAIGEALTGLAVGDYSDIVEAEGGYYLFLRTPVDAAAMATNSYTTRYFISYNYMYRNAVAERFEKMTIEYTDAYGDYDVISLIG